MSTRRLARWGAALVLLVLGAVGGVRAHPNRARAEDPDDAARDAKQGPELAASVSAAGPLDQEPSDVAPTLGEVYPFHRPHSPLTPAVAERLRAIAERDPRLLPTAFAKVGASATVNRSYLRCFARGHVDLDGREHLRDTIDHFNGGDPSEGWQNPFLRRSLSATVGWHAGRAVWGDPPPLVREVRAIDPRFAVVMYGTNDIELGRPLQYAELMLRLTRMLTRRGVIPILTTIMPRGDDADADRVVSLYNAILRGIAQGRRLPLIDYHRELRALPDHGLASDRLHPNVRFVDGRPRGCDFSAEGLRHGYNIRNLLTIEALDRVRRVVLEGEDPPDAPVSPPSGAGSIDDPIVIDALPFAHASDTSRSPHRALERYEACDAQQDESGPEVVYQLRLAAPAEVTAMVVDEGDVDVDLHYLRPSPDGPRCERRADATLSLTLDAGEHYFVADTFVDGRGTERAGRYMFVIARTDRPSDPD